MTAEEIRKKYDAETLVKAFTTTADSTAIVISGAVVLLSALGEIAAQLSELNKNLTTMGCTAVDIQHLLRLTTERIPNSESRRVRVG